MESGGAGMVSDGKRIAFEKRDEERERLAEQSSGESDVYIMNADGTEKTRLTRLAGNEVDVSWSPDGKQIAFSNQKLVDGEASPRSHVAHLARPSSLYEC